MSNDKAPIWVSKYWLTKGIYSVSCYDIDDNGAAYSQSFYLAKKEWHETKQQAIEQAKILRERKIISLKEQLASIESMVF